MFKTFFVFVTILVYLQALVATPNKKINSNVQNQEPISCNYNATSVDFISEIPRLNEKNVHIKNPEKFNEILKRMIGEGPAKLQVVSDFDKTLTKQHVNGTIQLTCFGIFKKCPSVTDEYVKTVDDLFNKYNYVDLDPHMTIKEKYKLIEEWWTKSENASKGLNVSPNEIEYVTRQIGLHLRDNTKIAFDMLAKENIPVLVFSAGLGIIVEVTLNQNEVLLPNVKIVSNFLKYNSEGVIEGFTAPPIHIFNKNEFAIKNTDIFNSIVDKTSVILLGDSIGDASMAEGINRKNNVLKIGFLYERKEENLQNFKDTFDIVLEDDQTMDVLISLLRCIFKKN